MLEIMILGIATDVIIVVGFVFSVISLNPMGIGHGIADLHYFVACCGVVIVLAILVLFWR